MIARALIAAILLIGTLESTSAQSRWTTFISKQFGLELAYPDHLIIDEESSPAEGRYALKHGAVLILSRDPLNGEGLQAFLEKTLLRGVDVTYSRAKKDWMAYSGFVGDQIVYGRSHLSCGGRYAHTFLIRYPAAHRTLYDNVVERLSHSLNVSRAAQTCSSQ